MTEDDSGDPDDWYGDDEDEGEDTEWCQDEYSPPAPPEKAASASLDKDTAAAFRARQYDKITVPKFPSAATVKNWMMSLGYNLTTAGGTSTNGNSSGYTRPKK